MIALFVVLGVGCYYHANQYPDYQNFWSGGWTEWRIWDLLYYPYWQIYAELNLDYLQGKRCQVKYLAGIYFLQFCSCLQKQLHIHKNIKIFNIYNTYGIIQQTKKKHRAKITLYTTCLRTLRKIFLG